AIAIESFIAPAERLELETIYYACPAAQEIATLFKALPNYPLLLSHVILSSDSKLYRTFQEAEARFGPIPAEDFTLAAFLKQDRPYSGSSFLCHSLPKPKFLCTGDYAVICPGSSWGMWPNRTFTQEDWEMTGSFLDDNELFGVVLGKDLPIPDHDRFIDLTGETTVLESIEILKGAKTYLGIDSWLSVLAAKLFENLSVKAVHTHAYRYQVFYYAPRQVFSFLSPFLRGPKLLSPSL
ncbi:MAG: hypothetical protein AAB538_06050, partial [Patescibacteria group bacterium]